MMMRGWFLTSLASIIILTHKCLVVNAGNDVFVKAQGENLMVNGAPFYGNGFNAYWKMYIASNQSERRKVSAAFEAAPKHGLTIARAWAFGEGGYYALQYSPGSYNEQMFQGLDFVISEARKYGFRLILSLVNNYKDFGGKPQYVEWARNLGHESLSSEDDFFSSSVVKGYYKNHVKVVLTRKNSITGVAYRDDPTIMAWELMNEPRCPSDPSGKILQGWIKEMASYLKSIDTNHLLEVGLEGFYGPSNMRQFKNLPQVQVGTDFIANNQVPGIDFATVHSYPEQWLTNKSDEAQLSFLTDWHNSHIQDAKNILRKPLLAAEFGKSSKDTGYTTFKRDAVLNLVYETIYSSAKERGVAVGGLFWQLLTEQMDSFWDGYEIIFSESPSTASLIAEQSRKLNKIRMLYGKLVSNGVCDCDDKINNDVKI